jgi:uncharacterized oligopeptide transporter (OPT) family protein
VTTQSVFLGLLIASLCGLLYHLIRGGRLSRLGLYVASAWVSFFLGQMVGGLLGWRALRVGPLNLLPALLATAIGLVAADVLAGSEARREREPRPRRPPGPHETP